MPKKKMYTIKKFGIYNCSILKDIYLQSISDIFGLKETLQFSHGYEKGLGYNLVYSGIIPSEVFVETFNDSIKEFTDLVSAKNSVKVQFTFRNRQKKYHQIIIEFDYGSEIHLKIEIDTKNADADVINKS